MLQKGISNTMLTNGAPRPNRTHGESHTTTVVGFAGSHESLNPKEMYESTSMTPACVCL